MLLLVVVAVVFIVTKIIFAPAPIEPIVTLPLNSPTPIQAEVIIDRLGIAVPIVWSTSVLEADLQKDLELGAIRYLGTPNPGDRGNSFITAHSSGYAWQQGQYKKAFVNLGKLNIGDDDIIVVYKKNGVPVYKAWFKVTEKEVVKATDTRMIEQKETTEMTLVTCWPIGTNLRRLMVKTELIAREDI